MEADPDTLCTVIYCTPDDLLPAAKANARRRVTDAEVVTLCVAQSIMGIASDRRFLRAARRQLGHLFPQPAHRAGYVKRRRRLADTIEWLLGVFAADSPGAHDTLLLICDKGYAGRWFAEAAEKLGATEPAPWPVCASGSWRASPVWRPASVSTTGWGARAVPSSTTAPEAADVESII